MRSCGFEAAGRPRDFRTLYEDEHRSLFQTLYFVTGDRHDAADLMHEAFLKVWGALGLDRRDP